MKTEEFVAPKQGTAAYKIAELLCKTGKLTYTEILDVMKGRAMKENTICNALEHMRNMGLANVTDKQYEVTFALRQWFGIDEPKEVAPTRTASVFRPLQAKNIPSLNPLLQGRFRTDIEFKTGSTDFYRIIGYRP